MSNVIGKGKPYRRRIWFLMAVAILIWSLLVVVLHGLANEFITWSITNSGVLADTGKGLVGKDIGSAVDALNLKGLSLSQLYFIQSILEPASVLLWAVGVVAIIAAPSLGARIIKMFSTRSQTDV
ncbi:hypothetical protein AB4Y96_16345 [Phyllobacterium sp. TAF24]|uniref:hypothetical protein n=1 Tax=Phyllobacterium sp. TAF24 TaxID=3233068 RepID=UPI003F96A1FC